MKTISIRYDDFDRKTQIKVDGKTVSFGLTADNEKIEKWLYPDPEKNWEGIFVELYKIYPESKMRVQFHGTDESFKELQSACEKVDKKIFPSGITIVHENSGISQRDIFLQKMEKVKELKDDLASGPVDKSNKKRLLELFERATNGDFEIVVVGNFSSGKSTLINAMLGKPILPAKDIPTTSTITKIRDNDSIPNFVLSAFTDDKEKQYLFLKKDESGNILFTSDGSVVADVATGGQKVDRIPATPELIVALNDLRDPDDKEKSLVQEILLEGDIPQFSSKDIKLVFVDTPGHNNDDNTNHGEYTKNALNSDSRNLVLIVSEKAQISSSDSSKIINSISDAMKLKDATEEEAQQKKDRFLFVVTHADEVEPEEFQQLISYEDEGTGEMKGALPILKNAGITDPQLFLVASPLPLLIRQYGGVDERDEGREKERNEVIAELMKSRTVGQSLTNAKLETFGIAYSEEEGGMDFSRSLYHYASISLAKKEEWDKEITDLTEKYQVKGWRDYHTRIAELNSGLPALEYAIWKYIASYAIPIKLKDLREAFTSYMEQEKESLHRYEELQADESELEKAVQEEQKKQKKLEEDGRLEEKLEQFQAELAQVKELSEKSFEDDLDNLRTDLYSSLDKAGLSDEMSKDQAQASLNDLAHKINLYLRNAKEAVEETAKKDALEKIEKIVSDYGNCVDSMKREGYFSVGGFSIERSVLSVSDSYLHKRNVRVAKKGDDLPGIGNAILRFVSFGNWGKQAKDKYISEEHYAAKEQAREQINRILPAFKKETDKLISEANKKIQGTKADAERDLKSVISAVQKSRKEFAEATKSREALDRRVKEGKERQDWLEKFEAEMNSLYSGSGEPEESAKMATL